MSRWQCTSDWTSQNSKDLEKSKVKTVVGRVAGKVYEKLLWNATGTYTLEVIRWIVRRAVG